MGAISKTKQYFLGIILFGLTCSTTLFFTQLFTNSTSQAATAAARLDDWRFTPEKLQLELGISGETRPRHYSLSQPNRIVIDLPNTKLGNVPQKQEFSGAIRSIRISQFDANVTRVVLDVAQGTSLDANQVQLQPFTWQGQNIWVLSPNGNPINNNSVAQNNIPANNIPGNFDYNQQPPLFPQIPGNNNFPNWDDPQAPLFPQLSGNNNFPPIYQDNQTSTNFSYSYTSNIPLPINPQFQPMVTVPPLNNNNNNQSSFNPMLPPAIFNNQSNFFNNIPPGNQSNFPMPNLPQYQQNPPGFQVLPYGEPLPQPGQ